MKKLRVNTQKSIYTIPRKKYRNINFFKVINYIKEIKRMYKAVNRDKKYYLELGNIEFELIKELGYLNEIYKKIEENSMYSSIEPNRDFKNYTYLEKKGAQFDFKSSRAQNRDLTDIVANVMYISNRLAHIFENNKFNELENSKMLSRVFYNIKQKCIEELLKEKAMGKEILAGHRIDNEAGDSYVKHIYYFALPRYIQPFIVHGTSTNYTYNFDSIGDFQEFGNNRSVVPLAIDKKNNETLRQRYQQGEYNKYGERIKSIIKSYLDIQKIFEDRQKAKEEYEERTNGKKISRKSQGTIVVVKGKNKEKEVLSKKDEESESDNMNSKRYALPKEKLESVNAKKLMDDYFKMQEIFNNGSLKEVMPYMYELIDSLGFWDQLIDFVNYGDKDESKVNRDGIYSKMWRYAVDSKDTQINSIANDIYITKQQLEEQFRTDENTEVPEILANTMILADTIVKLLQNKNNSAQLKSKGFEEKYLANLCASIRKNCQEELIKCRNRKMNLLIGESSSTYGSRLLNVTIPGYLEPFCAIIKNNSNFDELVEGYDPIYFVKQNGDMLSTTFPVKATPNQQKIMQYLGENSDSPKLRSVEGRINWFAQANRMFEVMKPKEKIDITGPVTIPEHKGPNISEREKYKAENREFLDSINEQIGGYIPENIIEAMLENAMYSMSKLYNGTDKRKGLKNTVGIKEKIKEVLVNVPETDREVEALKVFLYIRMTKPIAKMARSIMKQEQKQEIIENSVLEYSEPMQLFRSLIEQSTQNGEQVDYKKIKGAVRKKGKEIDFINKQPEEDILDAEQEENIEQEKDEMTEEDTAQRFAMRFNELNEKLKVAKAEYERVKTELEKSEEMLRGSANIEEEIENAIKEQTQSSRHIEEMKEQRRKLDEAIAAEEAKNQESINKVRSLTKKAEDVQVERENIEKTRARQKQLEEQLQQMENTKKILEDFMK